MAAAKKSKNRERRLTNAEKADIAGIICNEGLDNIEPILVKQRSKSISNKENVLFKIFRREPSAMFV